MVVLLATWVSGCNVDWVIKKIGMKCSHRVEAYGFSGGIRVLWNDKVCQNHFLKKTQK